MWSCNGVVAAEDCDRRQRKSRFGISYPRARSNPNQAGLDWDGTGFDLLADSCLPRVPSHFGTGPFSIRIIQFTPARIIVFGVICNTCDSVLLPSPAQPTPLSLTLSCAFCMAGPFKPGSMVPSFIDLLTLLASPFISGLPPSMIAHLNGGWPGLNHCACCPLPAFA